MTYSTTMDHLTIGQAAAELGLRNAEVYALVDAGHLDAVRYGDHLEVTRSSLEAYRAAAHR